MSEYVFYVRYSKTSKAGTRISCDMASGEVVAKDEDEVRRIMAEEQPGWSVDEIVRVECLDD